MPTNTLHVCVMISSRPTHYPCPVGMAIYWVNIALTGIFVIDVILRLSIYCCKRFFDNVYCVIDFSTTIMDVAGIILTALELQMDAFNLLLVLRLLRFLRLYQDYKRIVSLRLDANKRIWPLLRVRDSFLKREQSTLNGGNTMLEEHTLKATHKDNSDTTRIRHAKSDLWFKVRALQVRLLHHMQRLEQEYHMSKLLVEMSKIFEDSYRDDIDATVQELSQRAEERGISLYEPGTSLQAGNETDQQRKEQRAKQLERMRAMLLQLVLDPDEAVLDSALKLLLLNARSMKDLVLQCQHTKLMVGDFLNNKYKEMRQIVLEDVSPRVGQFELWAPVEAGKDNKRFKQNMQSLQDSFQELLSLSKMDGTELQVGLVEDDFIELLRQIIAIPKHYRDIGTNFKSDGKSAFIKDNPDNRNAVNNFIHDALKEMLSCLNEFLLGLLGFDSPEDRDKTVQTNLFPLMPDLLPWVGTVPKSELVIISIVKENEYLCSRIKDSFIEEAVKQFNDDKRTVSRVPIMTLITGICCVRENQVRCTNQLCKGTNRKSFFESQIESTYSNPNASGLEHNQAVLRMVSALCSGTINITEAKMLELLDYRMMLAAVHVPTSSWNFKLSLLDTFYHVVASAELKIEDVGRSDEIITLLRMFLHHLTTLCGWEAQKGESKDEGSDYHANLVTALSHSDHMFEGDPLCLYPPGVVDKKDSVLKDGSILELPVLVRFLVLHVAKIASRLCIRYGDDLSNFNGKAIRELSFCSFYLSKSVLPDHQQDVSRSMIKFCKAMKELHKSTVKIVGKILDVTRDLDENRGPVEAHFMQWFNESKERLFDGKHDWATRKSSAQARSATVDTTVALEDRKYDLAKRKQVQDRFDGIITEVRPVGCACRIK